MYLVSKSRHPFEEGSSFPTTPIHNAAAVGVVGAFVACEFYS
jgi:hypothetical protein